MSCYPFKTTIAMLADTAATWSSLPAEGTNYPAFFHSLGCKGLVLQGSLAGVGGSTSLTFTVKAYDPIKGAATDTLLASAAKTGNGQFSLTIYPGIAETANVDQSTVLPEYFMVDITGTPDSAKITVNLVLLP